MNKIQIKRMIIQRINACAYIVWFGWLNVFTAELTLKRYWQGPRFQEIGKG